MGIKGINVVFNEDDAWMQVYANQLKESIAGDHQQIIIISSNDATQRRCANIIATELNTNHIPQCVDFEFLWTRQRQSENVAIALKVANKYLQEVDRIVLVVPNEYSNNFATHITEELIKNLAPTTVIERFSR